MRVVEVGSTGRPRTAVWEDVSTVPRIAAAIPEVRRCERNGERWRWELDRYGALGLEVVPAFDVEAAFRPHDRVDFRPVGDVSEDASGRGWITLADAPAGRTRVEVGVVVEVDVPIPRLLAPALTKIMRREIRQVVQGLLASVT